MPVSGGRGTVHLRLLTLCTVTLCLTTLSVQQNKQLAIKQCAGISRETLSKTTVSQSINSMSRRVSATQVGRVRLGIWQHISGFQGLQQRSPCRTQDDDDDDDYYCYNAHVAKFSCRDRPQQVMSGLSGRQWYMCTGQNLRGRGFVWFRVHVGGREQKRLKSLRSILLLLLLLTYLLAYLLTYLHTDLLTYLLTY